jgi:phage repressor protein C with HTH and peptisase S24 domain
MTDKTTKVGRSRKEETSVADCAISIAEIAQRIAVVAKVVGSNSELARLCNVSPSVIGKWTSAASEPTAGNLVSIARAGNVTVEWLATGKEPRNPAMVMNAEGYLAVPLYDIRLVSICNDLFDAKPAAQSIIVPAAWPVENAGTSSGRLAFIRMHGDAMKPTLHDGDLLMIDRIDQVVSNGVYVFFLSGVMFIQRLQQKLQRVVFYEENDLESPPSEMPTFADFEGRNGIVGRVVWAGRKL